MKNDIYVDDEENENEIIITSDEPNVKSEEVVEEKKIEIVPDKEVSKDVEPPQKQLIGRPIRQKLSYRDQLLLRAQQHYT